MCVLIIQLIYFVCKKCSRSCTPIFHHSASTTTFYFDFYVQTFMKLWVKRPDSLQFSNIKKVIWYKNSRNKRIHELRQVLWILLPNNVNKNIHSKKTFFSSNKM